MKKNISPQELRKEIKQFLMEHKDAALGTCMNERPRTSPVQYFLGNDLDLYILSAGGEKFNAIKNNPNVCLLVNTEFITHRKIKGVQIFGKASTSLDNNELLSEAIKYAPEHNMTNNNDLKAIKIMPDEIVYLDAIEDGDRTKQILTDSGVIVKEDSLMLH